MILITITASEYFEHDAESFLPRKQYFVLHGPFKTIFIVFKEVTWVFSFVLTFESASRVIKFSNFIIIHYGRAIFRTLIMRQDARAAKTLNED